MIKRVHPKISECIEEMLLKYNLNFYAEFAGFITFFETTTVDTAGVNVTTKLNFYFNPNFFNQLSQEEANFVVIHEIFHLLFDHFQRSRNFIGKVANIAQDMIINELIVTDMPEHFAQVPKMFPPLRLPTDYQEERIFEILYHWLLNKQNQNSPNLQNPLKDILHSDDPKITGQFDSHLESDSNIKENVVNDVLSNLKNRGLISKDIESILGKLRKSKVNYLKQIKSNISNLKGKVNAKSFKKPNRRGFKGIKGKVKFSKNINCILDTSGSMNGNWEFIISYLLHGDCTVNVIQCDAKVHSVKTFNTKAQFNNYKINGNGGTELQPAINYLLNDKHLKLLNLVILTDGHTDSLDLSNVKQTLIISCGTNTPVKSGNYKEILVKQ